MACGSIALVPEGKVMFKGYAVTGFHAGMGLVLALIIIWSLIWKGIALWKAARNGQKVWYVVMLIVNTVGILEILYIFVFAKKTPPVQGSTDVTVKPQ